METNVLCLIAAAVVLYRVIHVIANLDPLRFDGHTWQFCGLAIHHALAGVGVVAIAFGAATAGGYILLASLAALVISDRRRS